MIKPSIAFICGNGDTLYRFRLEIIKRFLEKDYAVYALAPEIPDDFLAELQSLGVIFKKINCKRKTVNIFDTFLSILYLTKELKKLNPNIVFSYTHKAVVVGSICAFLAGRLRSFSLITGTGHIFDNSTIVERVKRFLGILGFKLALRVNEKIFFQNPDDLRLFCNLKMVSENKTFLVNGSGVDLDKFSVSNIPEQPVFLCMSRLIKSKGLIEYAEASRIVKKNFPSARFLLHGFPDNHNDSIDEEEIITSWKEKYGIEYLGFSNDPVSDISKCSVYVLLSYNEGTPRSVLEAMSLGRPIITTDVPGCRETVKNGKNGYLVPHKNSYEAAQAMMRLMDPSLRENMARSSREYCEEKFDVHIVNRKILSEMEI